MWLDAKVYASYTGFDSGGKQKIGEILPRILFVRALH